MTTRRFKQLLPRDRVTIRTPHGQELTGRVVMVFEEHAVLNLGGRHGTPGVATEENTVRVRAATGWRSCAGRPHQLPGRRCAVCGHATHNRA
jgi:hypothetical protein